MSVDRIIARHLSGGRAVSIPSVGVLYVDCLQAQQCDGQRRLIAPERVVRLGYFDACSLCDYVAVDMEVDGERAQEIVNEWFSEASDGARLVVEGVGELIYGVGEFQLSDEFRYRLNPLAGDKIVINNALKPLQPIRVKPPRRHRSALGVVAAVVCALAALGYLAYYFRREIVELIDSLIE